MPINDVRNTVLAIANKNNYGYISPADFNLYAKQAQMDMFEDYFNQYNNQLVRENLRQSGSGYADITKGLEEVIDSFSETQTLVNNGVNLFSLPSNYYLINKINYYPTVVTTSTTTAAGSFTLTDVNATFVTSGILAGQVVSSTSSTSLTAGQSAYIVSVDSNTQLTLTESIFSLAGTIGDTYVVVSATGIVEVERVNQNKIFYLNSSPLTSPSAGYPAYVLGNATNTAMGNTANIYPTTLTTPGTMFAQYVRYPNAPKWTYAQLLGGEPLFDATQADYQDFELPLSDEPILIAKICQYIGVEIREEAVYNFAQATIAADKQ
jgi:hypothetical protein|tara:strand:- start:6218 stop:7183 length:966 start_codon:yes stop_codon:yes gene_type:complete